MVNRIWKWTGGMDFMTVVICAMAVDLIWGYGALKYHAHLFEPINDMGFLPWARTWGMERPAITGWLFVLAILIALLGINTFVCTTERVVRLCLNRHRFPDSLGFALRFGPHIMHYSMLVMFLGYLVSYVGLTSYPGQVLVPDHPRRIDGIAVTLTDLDITYYQGSRMAGFQRRAVDVKARLSLEKQGQKISRILSFNRPVLFDGLSLHLKNFAPKTQSGLGQRRYVSLMVKRDPGVRFYFAGMAGFVLGLLIYLFDKLRKHHGNETE